MKQKDLKEIKTKHRRPITRQCTVLMFMMHAYTALISYLPIYYILFSPLKSWLVTQRCYFHAERYKLNMAGTNVELQVCKMSNVICHSFHDTMVFCKLF